MQKQAFLIIAHNEFGILQKLIDALDNECNDIYVHIDARVKAIPLLRGKHSRLVVLKNRMKVIWGHKSLPECEMRLMEEAMKSGFSYAFYHIISGTHYPLVSFEGLDAFFRLHIGKSVLQPMSTSEEEKLMRFGRYHYFMIYFVSNKRIYSKIYRFLWKVSLFIQKKLNMVRDYSHYHGKASNWCALSEEAVKMILREKQKLQKQLSHTFCSDEYFVSSVLEEHQLPIVYTDKLLFQEFVHSNPRILKYLDYKVLLDSGCMFGRKFTMESLSLIEKLKDGEN